MWLLFLAASKLHQDAMTAYGNGDYSQAARLFRQELQTNDTLDVREKLVISLYEAGWKAEAKAEYQSLRKRHPGHRFDPMTVLPETKADLEALAPPASAPVVIKKAQWHWYYLAPLGIGQYLAKSPVRGSIFLALELGFVAANVAGAVALGNQFGPDGTVRDLDAGNRALIAMNVGFFGIIASVIAAAVDGALFEAVP